MKPIRTITVVDSHTAGEPTRVVIGGVPHIPGESMQEKKEWLARNQDHLRTFLMWEPRGHRDMFGAIITAPTSPDADIGVIFMDNDAYLDMCGHASIGTVTVLLETGMVNSGNAGIKRLTLDTPAGKVHAKAEVEDGDVKRVTVRNVPSFSYSSESIKVSNVGEVPVEIAYGGNFFALVDIANLDVGLSLERLEELIRVGMAIKQMVNEQVTIVHPGTGREGKVDLVEIFDDQLSPPGNIVVFGAGQVDRSPCGTGTCAKMALLHSCGKLKVGEEYIYQSIIGTEFKGMIIDETTVGSLQAIIPEITGSAYITGIQQMILDKNDPLRYGFELS